MSVTLWSAFAGWPHIALGGPGVHPPLSPHSSVLHVLFGVCMGGVNHQSRTQSSCSQRETYTQKERKHCICIPKPEDHGVPPEESVGKAHTAGTTVAYSMRKYENIHRLIFISCNRNPRKNKTKQKPLASISHLSHANCLCDIISCMKQQVLRPCPLVRQRVYVGPQTSAQSLTRSSACRKKKEHKTKTFSTLQIKAWTHFY